MATQRRVQLMVLRATRPQLWQMAALLLQRQMAARTTQLRLQIMVMPRPLGQVALRAMR
jgi:hypothetical protein